MAYARMAAINGRVPRMLMTNHTLSLECTSYRVVVLRVADKLKTPGKRFQLRA